MSKYLKYVYIGAAAIVALTLLYLVGSFLLSRHDAKVVAAYEEAQEKKRLQADNKRLLDENASLKAQIADIDKKTTEKVEEVKQERAAAATPEAQVRYVASNTGIHVTQDETAPNIHFPSSELPLVADLIAKGKTEHVELEGCKEVRAKQELLIQNDEKVISNKDAEIALLKKDVRSNRRKWFNRGMMVGGAVTGIAIRFLL